MNKIKNFTDKYGYPIITVLVILFFSFWCGQHYGSLFSDRGRELLIPEEILNGKVPYKDITLIYFPLGFYINALFYKIMGVSLNTLLTTQTVLSVLYMLGFYFLSKEFLSKSTSFLLTLFIILSCIFAPNDLFSMIFPYSYARTYGIMASFLCVFCFIKLFKTDNIKYLYISAVATGFALSCKIEFLSTVLFLIIALFLYKKLNFKQYLKIFFSVLIFPILTAGILIYQGVTLNNIIDAINFGINFATTDVMREFLSGSGLYPLGISEKIETLKVVLPVLTEIILLSFIAFKLDKHFSKRYFSILFIPIIFYFGFNTYAVQTFWILLPYAVLIVFIIYLKDNLNNNKTLFILFFAALLFGQREFFRLTLNAYGVYSFPLFILSLCIMFDRYFPKYFTGIEIKKFVNYILLILIIIQFNILAQPIGLRSVPIITEKGTIYTKPEFADIITDTIGYIDKNISKNETILVLPEGTLINYLTDRKTDMHCFMLDRLYHDAYGEENAKNIIANTNSDYIILLKGFDLNNFYRPYLYNKKSTLSAKYIYQNYSKIKHFQGVYDDVIILKKK
ncbi:glycosyltransferase family 39 protein [bacterium]|nr:glycosyltransferase family 39 protein [bacterium]